MVHTSESSIPRRTYRQSCPLARALDAVGDRWTLLIVRELLLGPRRYGELQRGLPGIGTNLLADRLKGMERLGLVRRAPAIGGHRWSLTAAGCNLEPALVEVIRWAIKTRLPSRPDDHIRAEWDMVAMKALYRGPRDNSVDGRYRLTLNGLAAELVVRAGRLQATVGPVDAPEASIEMDSATGWMLAKQSLDAAEALKTGRLRIDGDRDRAIRLLACFRVD